MSCSASGRQQIHMSGIECFRSFEALPEVSIVYALTIDGPVAESLCARDEFAHISNLSTSFCLYFFFFFVCTFTFSQSEFEDNARKATTQLWM